LVFTNLPVSLWGQQFFETKPGEPPGIKTANHLWKRFFLRLREFLVEFPDGVVGIGHLIPVRSGWVVRVKGAVNFEGESGMVEAINIASRTTKTIAGWTDGEIEMWDVVMIFKNEDQATQAARENEQMAIYQIETSRLKWLD
jgi:hypothetical protein